MGDYVVLDRIGEGGMGQVYKAKHKVMERIVALKTLPASATKLEAAVKRFHREVKVAARLSHPNIVTAFDAGEAHGTHYLVMELVEGDDLANHVRQGGRLSMQTALDYTLQAARGLEYAHSEKVVHRDMKPSNLLLDKKGTVKVLDMGLARLNETIGPDDSTGQQTLTGTGQAMGTIDYMPPEQAENVKEADERSDIYSLGCTLHYFLTGRSVYGGDTTVMRLLAHRDADIPSLRAERPDVPEHLDAVFQKMVAKKREGRFGSMTEVIAELQKCAEPKPDQLAETADLGNTPLCSAYAETQGLLKSDKTPGDESLMLGLPVVSPVETLHRRMPKKDNKVFYGAIGAVACLLVLVVGVMIAMNSNKEEVASGEGAVGVEESVEKEKPATVRVEPRRTEGSGTRASAVPAADSRVGGDWALEFDGESSRVHCPSVRFDGIQPFSMEAYVTPVVIGESAILCASGLCLSSKTDFFATLVGRKSGYYQMLGGAKLGNSPMVGRRTHVAAVFDGQRIRLYVDGKSNSNFLVRSIGGERSNLDPDENIEGEPVVWDNFGVYLGCSLDSTTPHAHFHGLIDEVRISNIARYTEDFTPQRRFDPDKHTIALYHFDEGTGNVLKDSSGNGHDGKIVGAKWVKADSPPPVADWALRFDGEEDCVEIRELEYDASHPVTVEMTVCMEQSQVVNLASVASLVDLAVVEIGDSDNLTWKWRVYGNTEQGAVQQQSDQPVRLKQCVHLAACYDGEDLRLFVNGIMQKGPRKRKVADRWTNLNERETVHLENIWDEQTPSWLGGTPWSQHDKWLCGTIHEVRISNVARYTEDFTPQRRFEPDEHTMALYHFDEGSGDVLKDSSGNGHDGKIVGAKWVKVDDRLEVVADDPDRRAAEWVLGIGGTVVVLVDGEEQWIGTSEDLPEEDFLVVECNLVGNNSVNDTGLCNLQGLTGLRELLLNNTLAGDVGLENLGPHRNMIRLIVTEVTDSGLKHLRAMPRLQFLGLTRSRVSDDGLEQLKELRELRALSLVSTDVTDTGLTKLIAFPELVALNIDEKRFTEKGVAAINDLPKLTSLAVSVNVPLTNVNRFAQLTKIRHLFLIAESLSETDLAALRTALSDCEIHTGIKAWTAHCQSILNESDSPPLAIAPFTPEQAKQHQQAWADHLGVPVEFENSIGMKMVLIPPGEFMMGSSEEEVEANLAKGRKEGWLDDIFAERIRDESPRHIASITEPFYVAVHEVTVRQFTTFVKASSYRTEAEVAGEEDNWKDPVFEQTADHPVVCLSWNDSIAFCKWLSTESGKTFRLPIETEWEFACRAGSVETWHFGNDEWELDAYAWYRKQGGDGTKMVGQKLPNGFGLYDILGNASEWCSDQHSDYTAKGLPRAPARLLKGGAFINQPELARSAYRAWLQPTAHFNTIGFRPIMLIDSDTRLKITARPSTELAEPTSTSEKTKGKE